MDRGDHPRPNDTDSTFVGQIPAEQHRKPYRQQIGRPDRRFTLQTDSLTLHPLSELNSTIGN